MKRKNPFVVTGLVVLAFALIAMLNGNITGFTAFKNLNFFSNNFLSLMAPFVILALIFVISLVALKKMSEKWVKRKIFIKVRLIY